MGSDLLRIALIMVSWLAYSWALPSDLQVHPRVPFRPSIRLLPPYHLRLRSPHRRFRYLLSRPCGHLWRGFRLPSLVQFWLLSWQRTGWWARSFDCRARGTLSPSLIQASWSPYRTAWCWGPRAQMKLWRFRRAWCRWQAWGWTAVPSWRNKECQVGPWSHIWQKSSSPLIEILKRWGPQKLSSPQFWRHQSGSQQSFPCIAAEVSLAEETVQYSFSKP